MEGLDGVPKSTVEAAKWLGKASDNDDAEAQFYLGELFEHGDGVPQDLEEAGRLYKLAAERGHEAGQTGARRIDLYLGRYTKSLDPLAGEEDIEFKARRFAESARFKPPQKPQ
jgi:TPR repeat protein